MTVRRAFLGAGGAMVGLLALLVAVLAVIGALHRPEASIPAGVAGQYVTASGVRLRYAQAGQGPDVLLIHGSPGSIEDWEAVFTPLAGRYRVTAFDRPGHGYSEPGGAPHTLQANADAALALIQALGLKHVLVVGHSYGGSTAVAMAVRDPDSVHAIVVIGSRAYPGRPVEPLFRLLDVPYLGTGFAVATGALVGPSRVREGVRASFSPNEDAIPLGFIERQIPLWRQPKVATALAQERVTFDASLTALVPLYPRIRKPVYVVVGSDDRGRESSERLAHEVPGARLLVLEHTGHYVQYVHPETLLEVVDQASAAPASPVPPS